MLFLWGDNRRFYSYTSYIRKTFGERVQKLTIDAGFTCPNRDGRVGLGGCTFCNNESFNPSYCKPNKPISQQLAEGIEFHETRYRRAEKYMAYFQAYSNTYAPLFELKNLYAQALAFPNVVGIVVGTRPDCVDAEKLDYFAHLAKSHYVSIEYGVETCNNQTLSRVNRGHTFEQSVWAIRESAQRGIGVGAHFIIGLPGETISDIDVMVQQLNILPIDTVKFHQLQVIRNTAMEAEYQSNPEVFKFYTIDEYLHLLMGIVERLRPNLIIERLTSEAPPPSLVAPQWGKLRTDQLLNRFERLMAENDTWQGKKFEL